MSSDESAQESITSFWNVVAPHHEGHPVVLGGGKRIFSEDRVIRHLGLVETRVTTTGAILATYAVRR